MNAVTPCVSVTIRTADLTNAREVARIDAFVAEHPDATLFHRPAWSLAVSEGCRQRAHYLVAENHAGAMTGLLPLSEIRSRLFGNALVSAGFGVGGGIVVNDERAAAALAEAAWKLACARACATAELRGGMLPGRDWQVSEGVYAGFARALPRDPEAILKAISRKQRAEVRRALGFGLEVTTGTAADQRAAHYSVYAESVRNLGTPVFPRALFEAMLDRFGTDADILIVRKDGKPISAVLSFVFKDTVLPYWGGGTAEARTWRANELLYYELMLWAAVRGCTRFDFGRSKLGTGAFAYKKNWGFDPEPLRYAVRTAGGAPPRAINPLDPKYRAQVAIWQRLPIGLANFLGPKIARGLG